MRTRSQVDQRRRDVTRRGARIPDRASRRAAVAGASRGADRRRRAVDGLHGHGDDREPLLSRCAHVRAGCSFATSSGRAGRDSPCSSWRSSSPSQRARSRSRSSRRSPRAAPPRALRAAMARRQTVRSALRDPGRRRDSRRRRFRPPAGSAPTRSPRRVQHRRRRRLRRRLGRSHAAVAPPGARPSTSGIVPFAALDRPARRSRAAATAGSRQHLAATVSLLFWSTSPSPCSPRGSRRPHSGSQPLLPRAAARDRAARLGRGRSATAASRNGCWRSPPPSACRCSFPSRASSASRRSPTRSGCCRCGRSTSTSCSGSTGSTVALVGLALVLVFLLVPARAAVASPLAVLATVRRRFEAGLVGPARVRRGRSRSALPGHPGRRPGLDRSCRARWAGGRRAVDRDGRTGSP